MTTETTNQPTCPACGSHSIKCDATATATWTGSAWKISDPCIEDGGYCRCEDCDNDTGFFGVNRAYLDVKIIDPANYSVRRFLPDYLKDDDECEGFIIGHSDDSKLSDETLNALFAAGQAAGACGTGEITIGPGRDFVDYISSLDDEYTMFLHQGDNDGEPYIIPVDCRGNGMFPFSD